MVVVVATFQKKSSSQLSKIQKKRPSKQNHQNGQKELKSVKFNAVFDSVPCKKKSLNSKLPTLQMAIKFV